MTLSPSLAQLFQSGFIAALVTLVVNVLAPFLERYTSFARPGSSTHDATLRALNLLLNVGLALGVAALLNQVNTGQEVLAVIGFGIVQATGSHVLFASGNRSTPGASTTPASVPVDVASAVAAISASVTDAVNAAIAAQAAASK